jgi:predicted permease
VHDIRYALRVLRRQPGHALIAVLTMALGIGATATLFSVAYGVLLKPLPWPDADRLVRLYESRQGGTQRFRPMMTNGAYLSWQEHPSSTIEAMAAWSPGLSTLRGAGDPVRVRVAEATASLFPILGARPLVGSLFVPGDEAPGREAVVVLSYGLWQERYGGSRDAVGRTLQLDDQPYRIIGVLPRAFAFPNADTRAWTPLRIVPVVTGSGNGRTLMMFGAIARLKPGVTPVQAAAEGTARARGGPDPGMVAIAVFGSKGLAQVTAVRWTDAQVAEIRPAILVFLAAVGLLLLAATGNVASLQLARAAGRRREIAIRAALGAGGMRLARQFLVESLLLGLAGGIGGLLLAGALHRALPALLPPTFPRLQDVALDLRVVAFTFGVSLVTSLMFGLLPALEARRVSVVASLAEDGRAPVGGGGRSRASRSRSLIMTGQVAIACVLLVGAALLMRSFVNLLSADLGYNPDNVLTAELSFPDAFTGQQESAALQGVLDRLRASAGVTQAGVTNILPLSPGDSQTSFRMTSGVTGATVDVQAAHRLISPGYFAALGVRVVRGRAFSQADVASPAPAVIVNRTFADRYLGTRAVGARIPSSGKGSTDNEVIGIVDDVHHRGPTEPATPELYELFRQGPGGIRRKTDQMTLAVRTSGDPVALVPVLRAIVRQQDPSLIVDGIQTMQGRLMASLAQPRLYAVLLGGFAVFALGIASVGLFGVLAYSVAQRTREIGVRTALGARPVDILTLVMRQGLSIAVAGLAIGLAVAAAATRWLSNLLYGVTAYDAAIFAAVPACLLVVAVVACLVPARRAARLDPLRALLGR